MLTKITLELDNMGLNSVLSALNVHAQAIAALGLELQRQAREQIEADAKAEARKAKKSAKPETSKLNGHTQAPNENANTI